MGERPQLTHLRAGPNLEGVHMTQPDQMTSADENERPTTPDDPPAPDAAVDPHELEDGADRQRGAPAKQQHSAVPPRPGPPQEPTETVTSPVLEHLEGTIKKAEAAADAALSDHRE